MTVIPNMELEFRRRAPEGVSSSDHNSLMNVAPAPSRRDFAKSFGIGSGARGSVFVEMRK